MDDSEDPDDDSQTNSDLAEALIRLCPHLAPELERQIGVVVFGGVKVTVH